MYKALSIIQGALATILTIGAVTDFNYVVYTKGYAYNRIIQSGVDTQMTVLALIFAIGSMYSHYCHCKNS